MSSNLAYNVNARDVNFIQVDGVSIRLVMHEGQLYFVRFADDGVTMEGAQLVMDTIPAGDEGDATNASIESAISLAGITPAIYYANESAMLSSFVNQFNASSATTNSVESGSAIVDYTLFFDNGTDTSSALTAMNDPAQISEALTNVTNIKDLVTTITVTKTPFLSNGPAPPGVGGHTLSGVDLVLRTVGKYAKVGWKFPSDSDYTKTSSQTITIVPPSMTFNTLVRLYNSLDIVITEAKLLTIQTELSIVDTGHFAVIRLENGTPGNMAFPFFMNAHFPSGSGLWTFPLETGSGGFSKYHMMYKTHFQYLGEAANNYSKITFDMNISNLDIASTQWNNWAYSIVEAGMMFDGDNLTNAQGNTYRNWYPISTVKSEFLQDGKLKQELFPGHISLSFNVGNNHTGNGRHTFLSLVTALDGSYSSIHFPAVGSSWKLKYNDDDGDGGVAVFGTLPTTTGAPSGWSAIGSGTSPSYNLGTKLEQASGTKHSSVWVNRTQQSWGQTFEDNEYYTQEEWRNKAGAHILYRLYEDKDDETLPYQYNPLPHASAPGTLVHYLEYTKHSDKRYSFYDDNGRDQGNGYNGRVIFAFRDANFPISKLPPLSAEPSNNYYVDYLYSNNNTGGEMKHFEEN